MPSGIWGGNLGVGVCGSVLKCTFWVDAGNSPHSYSHCHCRVGDCVSKIRRSHPKGLSPVLSHFLSFILTLSTPNSEHDSHRRASGVRRVSFGGPAQHPGCSLQLLQPAAPPQAPTPWSPHPATIWARLGEEPTTHSHTRPPSSSHTSLLFEIILTHIDFTAPNSLKQKEMKKESFGKINECANAQMVCTLPTLRGRDGSELPALLTDFKKSHKMLGSTMFKFLL